MRTSIFDDPHLKLPPAPAGAEGGVPIRGVAIRKHGSYCGLVVDHVNGLITVVV